MPVACRSANTQEHHIEMANRFVISGDDASAAVEFEKALGIGRPNPRLQKVTGDCYARLKDYENAVKHYDAAVAILDNDLRKFEKMAAEEKDPGQQRLYREIIETRIYPLLAEIYVAQARVYSSLGRQKKSSAALELALTCDEKNLAARLLFARSLEEKGDYKRALKEWTAFYALAIKTARTEREAMGITDKEIAESKERIADLLARQIQE